MASPNRTSRRRHRIDAPQTSGRWARVAGHQTCVCPAAAYIICGMPTALWTGSLSFGLVVIPVRLYPAVRKKTVRFREIDGSGRRIRHVRGADPQPELDNEPAPAAARSFQWTPSPAPDVPPAAEVSYE